jgi:hypothetical protein
MGSSEQLIAHEPPEVVDAIGRGETMLRDVKWFDAGANDAIAELRAFVIAAREMRRLVRRRPAKRSNLFVLHIQLLLLLHGKGRDGWGPLLVEGRRFGEPVRVVGIEITTRRRRTRCH